MWKDFSSSSNVCICLCVCEIKLVKLTSSVDLLIHDMISVIFHLLFLDLFFFNWLFIVALTAKSYRDCHFFCLGMVLLLIY